MALTDAQLSAWVANLIWPFLRVFGLLLAAPLFSLQGVTQRLRTLVALVLVIVIWPRLPPPPAFDIISVQGFITGVFEFIIGMVLGFVIQLLFAIVVFMGQAMANSMGLGFAAMVDPQNGQQVPMLSQFYVIITTLLFLSMDAHLVLIELVLESFTTLPVGDFFRAADFRRLADFGSRIFAGGLLLAMPAVASLLLVNISFGVVSQAAPQLNIFAVGFPVTLLLGILLSGLILPGLVEQFEGVAAQAFALLESLIRFQGE
ncbi:MAG: flagellar biosynthetic protein FliR [Methylococcales bacterium]|nr:flagellar biosynthetic protein FliR [Methylococcales bacterium]